MLAFKSMCKKHFKYKFRLILLNVSVFFVFNGIINKLFNIINVECVHRDNSQIYDYSNFYQDDDSKLNDEFILGEEDLVLASKERNKNDFTTDGTFEEFQSFFIDRGKIRDREKYETPSTETPRRKSSRKHHKHRHRGKKTNIDLSQSLESFFNAVSFSQAPVDHIDKENEFIYEDDEISKNGDNLQDTTLSSLSSEEMEQKSLKAFEKFVKDVKENETQELLLGENYDDLNESETYQRKNIKHHINHEDRLNDNSPYLLKMLSSDLLVDPSPQELMMVSPVPFSYPEIPWPVKKEAVVEGDVNLGGLMMVHSREDDVTCGPIMPQGGIQALEAMLYTLDIFNKKLKLVPNVTIGAHILDDCDKDTYGLEMAVDFIKGSISNIDGAEYHCNKTQIKKVISGVVGAASSVTSIQVANLLRLFKIPQVSFFSTSPELSNKQRFEYFTRTIPSDHYQVKAMVDIIRELGWSYVSIIYEESNYGIKAFEELEGLLSKHNICIAVKEKLVKDSGVAEEIAYDSIVQKLQTKPRARGVIIFGSDQEVAGVMRAVRRSNATGAFSWIGSDGWSARSLVSDGSEPEVEGTLSVQPQANPVKGFEEYFLSLTVDNNERNPWFVEFWEDHFHCRYLNSSRTPYNTKYTVPCTGKEKLTRQNTDFEDQLQFVSDAVMAFAYAIKDMHGELCNGRPGLCDAMKPTKGPELLRYLRKVEFEGLSGDHFKFDSNGDGPARYNIIHFKQVSAGKHRWIKVGEYLEGELKLNMTEIQFKLSQPKPPESVCSLPCDLGQAKQYVEGESCCWHCFNCTQYQIRHPLDETQCVLCRRGTVPDAARMRCQDIPEIFLRPESGWAIGAMALSSTGILVTLFVAGVFLRHNDTPVVRASGRELSYVLLAGILMCYCVTFALVVRPSDIVCGIQRFGAGFCFTVVYAALLTKTNRISRIFNAGKQSAKRPSLISPRSQLIICTGLISVQVVINGVWMVISPARAMHHYPTREDNLLVCDSYVDASYMIAFSYPIVLIVVCTVYAVLTRKIPEAFNESKHIGFTMYTTCVIWLAFVPLYFGTGNHVPLRITSMSVTISLSASVTVACLFSPKLYIILIRPERNVRQSMMTARYSAFNKSSGTANSGAGSMMAAVVVTAATCNQKEKLGNKMQSTNDPDMELKKKVKLEERYTQTDSTLNNYAAKAKSVPSLTSLPTSVSNDVLAISKYHRKNSSDQPSTQSVIVKLNNNGASILCSVKPTAVNKSALAVTNLASAVVPTDSPQKDDISQNKNVTFDDEKNLSYGARPNNIANNNASIQCDPNVTNKSIVNPQTVINNTSINILIANSPAPGAVGNGPTVPSSLTENSVKDFAL